MTSEAGGAMPTGQQAWLWRLPVRYRIMCIAVQALLPAIAALTIWIPWTGNEYLPATLTSPLLAFASAGWLVLACRAWQESAMLRVDGLLVVRTVFRTRSVPVTEVTAVRFRKGSLLVMADELTSPAAPAGRHAARSIVVPALRLGAAALTGRRTRADEAADVIAAAAGLAPLPPRREIIGRQAARTMVIRGAVLLVLAGLTAAGSQYLGGSAGHAGRVLANGVGVLGVTQVGGAGLATLDRSLDRWRARAAQRRPRGRRTANRT